MLTRYQLEDKLSLVVPIAGFWMGDVEAGCLSGDSRDGDLRYGEPARGFVDSSLGYPGGGGPCSTRDESFREEFRRIGVSSLGDYYYPDTLVWFVLGGGDTSGAFLQGLTYYSQLLRQQSPSVRIDVLPNVPHGIIRTPEGVQKIGEIVRSECRLRR